MRFDANVYMYEHHLNRLNPFPLWNEEAQPITVSMQKSNRTGLTLRAM